MTNAWAGGDDWPEQTQIQQKVLDKAYYQAQPVQKISETVTASFIEEIKEPDWVDHAYVWARTFVPSWLMLLIFVSGVFTIVSIKFKKQLRKWLLGVLKEDKQ